jgi:hypothetical protein
MKRIYFNHISGWKNGIIIIPTLICFLISSFELFNEPYTQWNKRIFGIGSVLLVIFFLKMTYGRYYVGWNKVGITIRIKSFLGKSFNFKDVKSTDLQNGILTVVKKDGIKIELDLREIEKSDVDRLSEILIKNTVANKDV